MQANEDMVGTSGACATWSGRSVAKRWPRLRPAPTSTPVASGASIAHQPVKAAKKRGYVTRDELGEVIPPEKFHPEQIEDVVVQPTEMGICCIEAGYDLGVPMSWN